MWHTLSCVNHTLSGTPNFIDLLFISIIYKIFLFFVYLFIHETLSTVNLVQLLNSPFRAQSRSQSLRPTAGLGGRGLWERDCSAPYRERESRITCVRMFKTNQSKTTERRAFLKCIPYLLEQAPRRLLNLSHLKNATLIRGRRLFKNLDAAKKYFLLI